MKRRVGEGRERQWEKQKIFSTAEKNPARAQRNHPFLTEISKIQRIF